MRLHPLAAPRRRPAFTLIELMVVLIIVLILAAIAVAFVPKVNERQKVGRASDMLTGWLLTAKQRALRDGIPTGVRLQPGQSYPNNPNGLWWVTELQYVQQPDPYRAVPGVNIPAGTPLADSAPYEPINVKVRRLQVPNWTAGTPCPLINPTTTPANTQTYLGGINAPGYEGRLAALESPWINSPTKGLPPPGAPPTPPAASTGDFTGGYGYSPLVAAPPAPQPAWAVQVGDFLQVADGAAHRIQAIVNTGGYQVAPGSPNVEGDTLVLETPFPGGVPNTKNYHIVRAPRVLPGESPLQLPQDVAIDTTTNVTYSYPLPGVSALVTNPVDIMFSPSGGVIGWGSGTDKIILWVRDVALDSSGAFFQGDQTLVTIYVRTGAIVAHPVDTTPNAKNTQYNNPYNFTRDGRSSGL